MVRDERRVEMSGMVLEITVRYDDDLWRGEQREAVEMCGVLFVNKDDRYVLW